MLRRRYGTYGMQYYAEGVGRKKEGRGSSVVVAVKKNWYPQE
jgi:hypothetical protein